jgi:hypothetical protein
MKEILLSLLAEVENLSANQAVLNQALGARLTIVEAREAKGLALKDSRAALSKLRQQIEALA